MSTDAQVQANRANAQKSTGPCTPEGKRNSAQNVRAHGFTASTFAVVRLEELDEVAHLTADLVAVYQPINSQELFAIERIALAQQTLLRTSRLEAGMVTWCLDIAMDFTGDPIKLMTMELTHDLEITRAQNRNFAFAQGFHHMAKTANTWSLFLRYQAQAERHYRRAIEEFERLKALREDLPNEPNSDPQPEPNTPTCAPFYPNPNPMETGSPDPRRDPTPRNSSG